MRTTYEWHATFQQYGKIGSVTVIVYGTDLLDAASEAQRQRPSFYEPQDLALLRRRESINPGILKP